MLYKNHVENETGEKIKCIQSDNGREYINRKMLRYLDNCGIQNVAYNPQQGGRAERINRTLLDKAR